MLKNSNGSRSNLPKQDYPASWYDIDVPLYNRSVKLFNAVKNILGVKMQLHAEYHIQDGDIFLFNHFARFETFIPQFLIFEQTGAYSFAIAAGEFFKGDTLLSRYLQKVGAIPHDHPHIFTILASQILRGRKVVIFPEGGMVKDHLVVGHNGEYSIYSRVSGERRKQHTGAAVLAQGLELFKAAIRKAYKDKNTPQLLAWKNSLQLDSIEQLLIPALKPTQIVPANITFYPIITGDNWLSNGVQFFADNLSFRQTEELLVESNILLKNTDMDIRMGPPVTCFNEKSFVDSYLLPAISIDFESLDDIFNAHVQPVSFKQRLFNYYLQKHAQRIRDQYMATMYLHVTINLSHLAATLIIHCAENGRCSLDKTMFFTVLYVAVKQLQHHHDIYLHRSLLNPYDYSDLPTGTNKRFQQFLETAKNSGLIHEHNGHYELLPKLLKKQEFDHIRLENLVAVYCNEAQPIKSVKNVVIQALDGYDDLDSKQLAAWYFEDEALDLSWERHAFHKKPFDEINQLETADADPSPFFLHEAGNNGLGILLIHGLLASPAEVKGYGQHLAAQGYTVLGIRLKGHGSSPYALMQQRWQDWYASVEKGLVILKAYCQKIVVVGFSTGGMLGLCLAAHRPPALVGVCAVAVPIKFVNPAYSLLPLLHGANTLVDWLSAYDGIKPFIENDSEHPNINYRNMPVKSLQELNELIEEVLASVPNIILPVMIVQADHDPVVDFKSAKRIMDKLVSPHKRLVTIHAERHGILMENLGGTWDVVDGFIQEASNRDPAFFTSPFPPS